MIFSTSLVLSSYVLGILIFTILIRRYRLLGAGFYWVMYLTAFVLSILAFVGDTNILMLLLIVCTLALLIESIVFKASIKNENLSSFVLNVVTLIASIFIFGLYVYNTANDSKVDSLLFEMIRMYSAAALLGGVTTAMLLGHWYLVQPGLSRKPIADMSYLVMVALTINTVFWLVKPSMVSVITGDVSDGWGGTLGYMWLGSVVTTFVLMFAASKALKERSYSAVMATTGLLYLAILTANGVDLIPRAIFS